MVIHSCVIFALRGSRLVQSTSRFIARWNRRWDTLHRLLRGGSPAAFCRYSGLAIAAVWSIAEMVRFLRSK
jgi:hypothetical protein